MSKRNYIKDLTASQMIDGVYAIQNCQLGQTRSGKPFLKCLIADKTGRTPGRMWNATEELYALLPTDGFVRLQAQTQPYQGEMQLIIQKIEAWEPSEADLTELLPSTDKDIDLMFGEVLGILDSLENPTIVALAQAYTNDDALMSSFRQAPAAMALHHAYLGGLLEHTLSLLKVAQSVLPLYPKLNRDIVLMGLFLHDLGKCVELTWRQGFSYSDEGLLIGHIARGVIWLDKKAEHCRNQGAKIHQPTLRILEHIILSHHGKPEFGAAKIPASPEAVLVSLLDNVDAKMQMALAAAPRNNAPASEQLGSHFSDKIWALETRIYRPDPATLPDEPTV